MKMKRFLSIALALCMMLSLLPADVLAVKWPEVATRAQMPQRGTDAPQLVDGYYEIYTADQLYWFAEQVNGGSTSINGKLMADIVVNENVLKADGELNGDGSNFRVWTPMGHINFKYAGIFDGNGKVVSGLYFNKYNNGYVGLFVYLDTGGVVKNVGVVDSYLRGSDSFGGVVAINYGTVSGCYNASTIIGCYNASTISGCYNDNLIIGHSFEIGGVVGENYGTISDCYNSGTVSCCGTIVGGVVANNNGTVSGCYNTGAVRAYTNTGSYVGGVVGSMWDDTIVNCYNTGIVIGSSDCVGGVLGGTVKGTVSNCYNVGNVSGKEEVAGVVGRISDSGIVSNCFNIGSVSGNDYIGGIVGYNASSATISNSYYLSGCIVGDNEYGTEKTAEQFGSGEVAYLLQGSQTEHVWGQGIGTDVYPVLGGAKVYKNRVGGCNESSYTYGYSNMQADAVTTHDWSTATCTQPKICTDCGLTEGNALGHNWTDATCTMPSTCTACGDTTGTALGHNWAQATCTMPSTCTTCGAATGNALGHQWENATCTTAKTCTVCGTTSGNPLGHRWAVATCTEPKTCTVCGATTGIALGHSWTNATCTAPKTCTVCGLTDGNPLGHRWAEATCTAPETCNRCGLTEGNALGHSWKVATCTSPKTCTLCGLTEGNALGHNWGDATCTEPQTCTVCGITEGEPLGHEWELPDCVTPATCSICGATDGDPNGHTWADATCTEPQTCTVCGASDGDPNGHTWADATCTDPQTCTVCGATDGEPNGHTWAGATCTGPQTCTVCGETTGNALDHAFVNGFCSLCDGYEPAVLNGDVYEISNAGQLYWFAEQVNTGNTSINGKLMADIVVNKNVLKANGALNGSDTSFRIWTPIGSDAASQYMGVFDGNEKTISGLYFNRNASLDSLGLFGYVYAEAEISNIGIVDSYFRGNGIVGGVVGQNSGTIRNCYYVGNVYIYESNNGNWVGGVVGYNNEGTVLGCFNKGTVINNSTSTQSFPCSGGVVGRNDKGLISNCYNSEKVLSNDASMIRSKYQHHFTGGIVGYNNEGTVIACQNSGSITVDGNGSLFVGGIVGLNRGSTVDCSNTGNISASVISRIYAGGVAGCSYAENNSATLSNCNNQGSVSGIVTGEIKKADSVHVGGVVGSVVSESNYSMLSNCYNIGEVLSNNKGSYCSIYVGGVAGNITSELYNSTITNCYNTGSVDSDNSGSYCSAYIGGVVGSNESGSITNSYNIGNTWGRTTMLSSRYCVGGVAGYNEGTIGNCYYLCDCIFYANDYGMPVTSDRMASGEVAYLLQGEQSEAVWGQWIGVDSCPILYGAIVYKNQTAGCCSETYTYEYSNSSKEEVETHNWIDATCTMPKMCIDCGKIDSSALGHPEFVNGFCVQCDGYQPAVLNKNIYEISNAGQLYWFAAKVNAGEVNIKAKLMADIVINENVLDEEGKCNSGSFRPWIPINGYNSNFNGNGKTISGLYIDDTYNYVGLFGVVETNGFVQKLGLIDSWVNSSAEFELGSTYTGAVVGYNKGWVINCYNAGSVCGINCVGGVVGFNDNGYVTECYNTGNVSSYNENYAYIGGIVGYNYASDDYSSIRKCYNEGDVSGRCGGNVYIGGVVGYNYANGHYADIDECYNIGSVNGSIKSVSGPIVAAYVGGVVGYVNADGSTATISSCYNTGCIIGSGNGVFHSFVGGVTGYIVRGSVTDCINTGIVSGEYYVGGVAGYNDGSVSNSYNIGNVSSNFYVGGVVGYNCDYRTVKNCYYLSGCVANGNDYGTTKTRRQFASGEVAYLLQGDRSTQIWGQKIGKEQYPVFSQDKVYCITDGDIILGYSNVEGELPLLGVSISGGITSYLTDGDVTVELLQGGEVVHSVVVYGKTVEYRFDSVMAGVYTLRVSKDNHVIREYELVVGDSNMTMDAKICPIGDVTGDGNVNIKDFQRLLRHVNKTNPLTDYELACGDVTGDGVCNIKDFQCLLRHVNKTNPLF